MLKRILLEGGHASMSLNGVQYSADEDGAFMLPEEVCDDLIRIHGGRYDPGIEILELRLREARERVAATTNLLELQKKDLVSCQEAYEEYKIAHAKPEPDAAALAVARKQQGNQQQHNQTRR